MKRIASIATIVACLSLASAASAQVHTLPLASPPPAINPTASTIFDALIAIGRAAGSDPHAAQNASFSYAAAIQQYNAGDLERARRSAIDAIAKSNVPTLPQPTNAPPNVSPQPLSYMPAVTSVTQSEMEERLALARRALTSCGPTTSPTFATARSTYDSAVQNELTQRANALNAEVQSIIDSCAAAPPQMAPAQSGQ